MKRKQATTLGCLLAAMAIGLVCASSAEKYDTDPKHQLPKPDKKPGDMTKPVKVFIMMGQSNMFGMGDVSPLEKKGTLEYVTKTEKRYPHLLDEAGAWTERSDVRYVQVMQGKGGMQVQHSEFLTVKGKTLGPEIQFGHILGQMLDEPVLLLKSCIGNRSLGWDLLPPGSERYTVDGKTYAGDKDTPDSWIEGQPKKEVAWYAGKQYDDDIANAKKHPEFAGNVKCVDIRDFWPAAEDSPNAKQGYHYFKNAGTYMEVGNALGWAMADLLKK